MGKVTPRWVNVKKVCVSRQGDLLREVRACLPRQAAAEGLEAGVVAQAESVVAGGDKAAESLELQSCQADGDPRETNRCFCFALLPSAIRKIALLPFAWGEKNPVTSSS